MISVYFSLLKPGIAALLVLVALASALVAAGGTVVLTPLLLLAAAGGMAAGGSGALNHYLERDLDVLMARTRRRPLVSGHLIRPRAALTLGLTLVAFGVLSAALFNLGLAFFILAGAFVYVVVYTLWLKRRSPWNVVIGGAAGSCAVLSGWSTFADWRTPSALLLATLLFLWTPPHFWSLATSRIDDYRRAGVPMLPVVAGPRAAAAWGLLHVLLLLVVSWGLARVGAYGPLYLPVALAAGLLFTITAARLWWRPDPASARLHFRASLLYLVLVLAGLTLDLYIQ